MAVTVADAPQVRQSGQQPEIGSHGLRHLPGLDGLRAIAVLAVMVFHAGADWLPGGFLGVDVFFVLSGFLITSLVLVELTGTGRLNLKRFYLRRARRLLPAVLLLLAVVGIVAAFWATDAAASVRRDIPAALFYVTNWSYVVSEQSYFEAIGRPPLLQHLWSLAVEEQFYLVWPLLALLAYRFRGTRAVRWTAILGALAITAWMALLANRHGYPWDTDPSRAYFGSDTHSMGLLVGAALATIWRPGMSTRARLPGTGRGAGDSPGDSGDSGDSGHSADDGSSGTRVDPRDAPKSAIPPAQRGPSGSGDGDSPERGAQPPSGMLPLKHQGTIVSSAALVCLAGLLWTFHSVTEMTSGLYRGGFLAIAVLTAAVIVTITHPASAPGRWLGRQPWRYIGERSYGLYLWHWPVFLLLRPGQDIPWTGLPAVILMFAVTFGIAELSYRYVEMPVRRGTLGRQLRRMRTVGWQASGRQVAVVLSGVLVVALLAGVVTERLSVAAQQAEETPDYLHGAEEITPDATAVNWENAWAAPTVGAPGQGAEWSGGVTAIGESVMLGARDPVFAALPQLVMDASVSRQAEDFPGLVGQLRQNGQLAQTVLVHLGTNGYIRESELVSVLGQLADRERVVIVTPSAPRNWIGTNLELIYRVVPRYQNARIADWNAIASADPGLTVGDGVHSSSSGAQAYAALLTDTLAGFGARQPVAEVSLDAEQRIR